MRNIRTETAGCLTGVQNEGGVLTARFVFPETFIGFQGHFPGNQVLPGVCQILCVLVAVEHGLRATAALREVLLAKYAAPVLPGAALTCTVQTAADAADGTIVKARLECGGKKVAELKLRVALDAAAG